MLAIARFAPLQLFTAAAQAQRHAQLPGMLVQHAKVELHHVPTDDRVGVVAHHPLVERFKQLHAARAVYKVKIHRSSVAVGRAEHVYLALATALQANAIQFAALGGLDVQRRQA